MSTPPREAVALDLIRKLPVGAEADFMVDGICMSPLLRDGDIVTVRRTASASVADVVAVVTPLGPRLHRLVRISPLGLLTAGDRSTVSDGPLPWSALIGVAVGARRDGRSLAIGSPLWRAYGHLRAGLQRHPDLFELFRKARRTATDQLLFSLPARRVRARLLLPGVTVGVGSPDRDLEALSRHYRQTGGQLPGWLTQRWGPGDESVRVFVACRGTRLVGWLVASPAWRDGNRAWVVLDVLVERRWQGAGVGRALLEHAIRDLRQGGLASGGFTAQIPQANRRSLSLFSRLGFAIQSEAPGPWPAGLERLIVRLAP